MLEDSDSNHEIVRDILGNKVQLSDSEHLRHVVSHQVSLIIRQSGSRVVRQEFGHVVLTTARLIWIPVDDDAPVKIISLRSFLSVGKAKRQGWFVRGGSCELTIKVRVDRNGIPTADVLEFSGVLDVVICATKHKEARTQVGKLHDAMSIVLGQQGVLVDDVPSTCLVQREQKQFEGGRKEDECVSIIVGMGYDEKVARAARDVCGSGSSVEEVVAWLLDNEASLKLRLDQEDGFFDVGDGGLGAVFAREKKKLDKDLGVIRDGLESLEKLESLADTMEGLAHDIFDRKKIDGETQDDVIDDILYTGMVRHALVTSLSKEHVQNNIHEYYEELARHIGRIVLDFTKSSYGVVSLPEAYRLYNRSRFKEAVPPRDFLQACMIFDRVGMPLRVVCTNTRGNANRVIFSIDESTKEIHDRIVSCIPDACEGISRVEIALRANLPVAIARYYLEEAEFQGLIVRDDGPRGLFYYKNIFHEYTV